MRYPCKYGFNIAVSRRWRASNFSNSSYVKNLYSSYTVYCSSSSISSVKLSKKGHHFGAGLNCGTKYIPIRGYSRATKNIPEFLIQVKELISV